MILVDANILLYAYDTSSERHAEAGAWLEATISGGDPVRLPWATLLAFVRIATNPRVFDRPLGIREAAEAVDSWLAEPSVDVVHAGERHWSILRRLLVQGQVKGPLVTDAHLAALAIEHGATLATTDRDFARFPGLRWVNPLSGDPVVPSAPKQR